MKLQLIVISDNFVSISLFYDDILGEIQRELVQVQRKKNEFHLLEEEKTMNIQIHINAFYMNVIYGEMRLNIVLNLVISFEKCFEIRITEEI